jgi:hypothetical protein
MTNVGPTPTPGLHRLCQQAVRGRRRAARDIDVASLLQGEVNGIEKGYFSLFLIEYGLVMGLTGGDINN